MMMKYAITGAMLAVSSMVTLGGSLGTEPNGATNEPEAVVCYDLDPTDPINEGASVVCMLQGQLNQGIVRPQERDGTEGTF